MGGHAVGVRLLFFLVVLPTIGALFAMGAIATAHWVEGLGLGRALHPPARPSKVREQKSPPQAAAPRNPTIHLGLWALQIILFMIFTLAGGEALDPRRRASAGRYDIHR